MAIKEGVIIKDDNGNTGYPLTHATKVLYPSALNPSGTTTLVEALSGVSINVQTSPSLEDGDFYDPVVDPVVQSYIDSLLAKFISDSVTIQASSWALDAVSGYYKSTVAFDGMAANTYPNVSLIPSNGIYATATENTDFKKIILIFPQENSIVFYATTAPTGTLKIIVKGILDYTGLSVSLSAMKERISVLETIVNSIPVQYTTSIIIQPNYLSSGYYYYSGVSVLSSDRVRVSASPLCTISEYNAIESAKLVAYINGGGIGIKCYGVVPSIQIPVIIEIN